MKHYLSSEDGSFSFAVEMGCNHPNLENNSTDSIGCNGNCEECRYSIASTTIPEMMELLRRAECTKKNDSSFKKGKGHGIQITDAVKLAGIYFMEKPVTRLYEAEHCFIAFAGIPEQMEIVGNVVSIDKETAAVRSFILPDKDNFRLLQRATQIDISGITPLRTTL